MTNSIESITAPKILLEGSPGTGKTYSIGTLVDWAEKSGKEVFVLFAENGLSSLLNYWGNQGKPIPECLHYHVCLTRPLSLNQLITTSDNLGKLSYDMLIKMTDSNRGGDNNSFHKILSACNRFIDDHTGKDYGSIEKWGSEKILVIDSFTTLCNAAMKMIVGNKPALGQSDYGQAQNMIMNFLGLLTDGCSVPLIMIAHVSREVDEITGATKIMTQAIGRAISGQIPRFFPDVIYTVKEGTNFYWDTAAHGVDTKATNVPLAAKMKPDFTPIFDKWIGRGK